MADEEKFYDGNEADGTEQERKFDSNNNMAAAQLAQAVSIKAPVFSETSPALWFRILEAQFNIKGIMQSKTKYYHALSSLPTEILDNVPPDIIEGEDYATLKDAVVSFYEQTKPELFAKLTSSAGMTGRPSVYLRRLQQVASKVKVGDDLVKHQFIKTLPSTIAPVVAAQSSLTLTQLGAMADELMPLHTQINNVVKHEANSTENRGRSNFNSGNAEGNHNQGNQGYHNRNQNSHQRNFNSHLGVKPFHPDQKPKICRGHIYYADNSRTCKNWCKYPNKANCQIQPSSRPASRSSSPVSRQVGN